MFKNRPVVEQVGGHVVVSLTGEIDLAVKTEVAASFEDAMALVPVPHILVDVSGVTFMDSSALGALAVAVNRVRALGGTLSVIGASDRIRRLLHIVQLDRLLTPWPEDSWPGTDDSKRWASPTARPVPRVTQNQS